MTMLSVLQENLLVVLSFDDVRAKIVRNTIDVDLFGGLYKTMAVRIYDFIDKHGKPPGEHLPDILADKLDGKSSRESKLYEDIIESVYRAQEGLNPEYVMSQLEQFARRQSLRTIAIDLAKALQRDTEESLDEADSLIRSASTVSIKSFEPGTRLSDKVKALKFLESTQSAFPTGIPELDKRGFGPTRKEMWLGIGDKKAGKTWLLIQLAKIAVLNRLKTCHISLEMSESKNAQRYFQTLFAISKRKEKFRNVKFERDKLGKIEGFEDISFTPKLSLDDKKIESKLGKLIDKWSKRYLKNIIIKQFPTGSLTVQQLEAYLDNLEMVEHFVPDLLIVDYPDIMKTDPANLRNSLDDTFKGLRGIAVKRNLALATVSQSNRAGAKAKSVSGVHIGEDYRKLQHADTAVTYSQTEHEKRLGLARLKVVAARNDQDGVTIVISQRYGTGTFVLDSNILVGNYWGNVGQNKDDTGETEDESP